MNNIISIAKKLKSINKSAYVIWSYCVSRILWIKHYWDTDLATDALPEEMEKVLNVVWNVWKKYWTLIIKEWWEPFEITTFRKDIWSINQRKPVNVAFTHSLEEDAARRDFTVNCIYLDPLCDKYIDPFWWIKDLENNIIRFVWDINERLNEDVLRLLRYVRLKSKLWLKEADANYNKIIKNRVEELENISVERIKEELDKILLSKLNIDWLKYLKEIWFFARFIPDIDNLSKTIGWPKHHLEWNVWIHSLMLIEELNKLDSNDLDMYWACLLHDIWKFQTIDHDKDWNVHYYNHDKLWAQMFKKNIARKFRFSKKSTDKIFWLIDNHIRIIHILEMKKYKAYRFILNKHFKDLITLCRCDSLWKIPREWKRVDDIEKFYTESMKKLSKVKLLTWDDILKKWPNLKWNEIGKRLEEGNSKVFNSM